MKSRFSIVAVLVGLFIVTQLLGLAVISAYSPQVKTITEGNVTTNITVVKELPYGMEPPKTTPQNAMISIIISIIIVILVFLLFVKINAPLVIKIWFFSVVTISIAITLTAIFSLTGLSAYVSKVWKLDFIAIVIALIIASFKIFRPTILTYNLAEILVYPGLAAVFVPILSPMTVMILLFIISIYDMYAVWKSDFMMNMAKYQMKTVKIFNGFIIPHAFRRAKGNARVQMGASTSRKIKKNKKIAIAILGGGDVAFPLIFAGVILRATASIPAALIIVGASALSLVFLMLFKRKDKASPALPFLSIGCLIGYLIVMLI
jgi:presenilin-like A22 family membrane protease